MPANPTPEELAPDESEELRALCEERIKNGVDNILDRGCLRLIDALEAAGLYLKRSEAQAEKFTETIESLGKSLEAERAKVTRLRAFAEEIFGDQDLEPGYGMDARKALEESE